MPVASTFIEMLPVVYSVFSGQTQHYLLALINLIKIGVFFYR